MVIDVIINSCARPDIMEVSLYTFRERIKTQCRLRYVLLEDKVDSAKRQAKGKEWIESKLDVLDEVVYAPKKMGPGYFFAPAVTLCKSDYFFHLEDDNEFIVDINIDPVLEFMKNHDYVVEVMLNRGNVRNIGQKIRTEGVKLTDYGLFSVATGLFNTKQVRRVINEIGAGERLHEFKTLTPVSNDLNLKRYLLGHGKKHYIHVGEIKKYRKGTWKKI